MLGLLYLLVCMFTGCVICSLALPQLEAACTKTYRGNPVNISKLFLLVPAWFVSGTLVVTWVTYICGYLFKTDEEPLYMANIITLTMFIAVSVIGMFFVFKKKKHKNLKGVFKSISTSEIVFIFLVLILCYTLMWRTFYVEHNHIYVGLSVCSDFSPHLGMIRSFSKSNNFPTRYLHFTGEDIRYHFMFEFLVGNLEYLGMRIDLAFNIPSFLGMFLAMMSLYFLAVKLSGKKAVGFLSCLFFAFRSSQSLFRFLADVPKGMSIISALKENEEFLGYTTNENWGLYNLNVYCNQRHLAFAMILMIIAITLFLPGIYDSAKRVTLAVREDIASGRISGDNKVKRFFERMISYVRNSLFSACGWQIKNINLAIVMGVLLGSLAFFNGAVLVATLLILFFIAVISDRRLELAITAAIAVGLAFIQTSFFIDGSATSASFNFGYLADNRTFFGVADFVIKLLGIMPILLIIVFVVSKKLRRYTIFAFSTPFIFALTVSLTTDIAVNHKYIMMSVALLNIFVAIFICNIYANKGFLIKALAVLLVIVMIGTGLYEYVIVMKKNSPEKNLTFDMDNELTEWVINNTDCNDTFLTSMYSLNNVVLGGGMLYLGWPYYAWSAGYDTDSRFEKAKIMFSSTDIAHLRKMFEEEGIDYVVADHDLRCSEEYDFNEQILYENFEMVYKEGDGEWQTTIYKVR